MEKILIVEDSKAVGQALSAYLKKELGHPVDIAQNLAQAKELVHKNRLSYFVALLDLVLPDAPNGEIVDLMLMKHIPSIIVTGSYDEETRERMSSKQIVDFVVKQNPEDLPLIRRLVNRVFNNRAIKVLLVSHTPVFRRHIHRLLNMQQLQVFAASNGQEALEILQYNQDIKMVLTDYNMPVMNGYELTVAVRKKFNPDQLCIIVFCEEETRSMFPKLLKSGVNDFMDKNSSREEFLCRLNIHLDMLELIEETKESANKDYLTGLYNRRCLFIKSAEFYERAAEIGANLCVAVLDIDHFKRINDTYGHDIGDIVIKTLSTFLKNHVGPRGLVARIGGEEFCTLNIGMTPESAREYFERMREGIAGLAIEEVDIRFTISIGVTLVQRKSLDAMISGADQMLYKAKDSGRNQVQIEF